MADIEREAMQEFEIEEEAIGAAAAEETPGVRISMPDFSFLKAKTGQGSIEEYINHPFNRHSSRAVAQILRGVTGIAGDLDYAVIDIALGVIELTKETKERKGSNAAASYPAE